MITVKKTTFKKLYDIACESWKKKFDEKFKTQVFSEDVEFDDAFLNEMQGACNDTQRPVFNKMFEKFLPEDLFSKYNTYSLVCKKLGVKELTLKDFKDFGEDARKMLAFHKIKNLEKLFNGDWKVNLKDPNQKRWYPYFIISVGGLAFYDCNYNDGNFVGYAGLFEDKKTAEFVGRTFIDIYSDLH